MSARFGSGGNETILLEFDQPVVWSEDLVDEFYLDDEPNLVASGTAVGERLTLELKKPVTAQAITYLKEKSWSQKKLLKGSNGIAALTFCDVRITPSE